MTGIASSNYFEGEAAGVLKLLKAQNPNMSKEGLKDLYSRWLRQLNFSQDWVEFFFPANPAQHQKEVMFKGVNPHDLGDGGII